MFLLEHTGVGYKVVPLVRTLLEFLVMNNLTKKLNSEPNSFAYGGFGSVSRAVLSTSTGASGLTVAIKFPDPTVRTTNDPVSLTKLKKRWEREVTAGQQVAHPNILPFLGICDNPDPRYEELFGIVLPYCANGNASKYLDDHPQAGRLHILCGVAAALFALHSSIEPVIHGDIKAANVLIGGDGQALLADFGLSRIHNTRGFTTESVPGTCRYMATELFTATPNDEPIRTTTESDVWAFGMTILEILTSRAPFAEFKRHETVLLEVVTKKARPERPREIPDAIWTLLTRCWEEEPRNRPNVQHVGLVLDLVYTHALNETDSDTSDTAARILEGTWDAAVPHEESHYSGPASLPYKCKWPHCPRSFATMEDCIKHERVEFSRRRAGNI